MLIRNYLLGIKDFFEKFILTTSCFSSPIEKNCIFQKSLIFFLLLIMNSNHQFNVKLSLRLDWSEMDLFGHINNVMYFKYIKASRVNYWETMGIAKDFATTKVGPILASTKCNFLNPLHYTSNIIIQVPNGNY